MSSFYSDASLVMIPSGYKAGKVYSAVPTDGTGDLTFTRSLATATRVGPDGLIEKVRTNLVLQSEAFNTTWAVNGIVVTANTTANPLNGAVTADTITASAANNFHLITQSVTYVAGETTISVYVKANGYSFFLIDPSISNVFGYFNVTTGAVGTKGSACTSQIENVGNGFYRCSITFTATAVSAILNFSIRNADNGGAFLGDGVSGFFIFGAQAENGVATTYIPTTTAAVSVGMLANVPRLDYLGGGCGKLLLEPQRSNTTLFSEQLNNAYWQKYDATIGANVATSPAGFTDADKLQENATTNLHYVAASTSQMAATNTYTASAFFKASERSFAWIFIYNGVEATGLTAFINLSNGTLGTINPAITATITDYGNGWYRCTATRTITGSAAASWGFGSATANGTNSYLGTAGSGIFVYGCQLEVGSYATSYIPTLGAAVTRSADAASKTGISALIGVNGGSIFVEFDANGLNGGGGGNYIFDLSDGTNSTQNRIAMYWTSDNDLSIFYAYGGTHASVTYNFNFLTTKKVAVRWTSTQIQAVVNGVAQTAVTYGNSSPTKLNIGSRFNEIEHLSSNAKQCLLFNTTLTAAQLTELTTI